MTERSRRMILRDAEIKFITTKTPMEDATNFPAMDKAWIHLILEDHPQEQEVTDLVTMMLDSDLDAPNRTVSITYWSTPVRVAIKPSKPNASTDMRRMLKTNIHRSRCPIRVPEPWSAEGTIKNVLDVVWAGQRVDVQLDFYRANIRLPYHVVKIKNDPNVKPDSDVAMVYANAVGFKLVGGCPRGLEGL